MGRWLTAAAACAVLALQAPAQEAPALAQRLEKGATARYRIERTFRQTVEAPGHKQEVHSRIEHAVETKVLERTEEGNAVVEVAFKGLKGTVTPPMGKPIDLDSSREEDQGRLKSPTLLTLTGIGAILVGRAVRVTLNPKAEIVKLSGADEAIESIRVALDKDPMFKAPAVRAELEGVLSEEAVRHELESLFVRLPAAPVEQGSSWKPASCPRCAARFRNREAFAELEPVLTVESLGGEEARITAKGEVAREEEPSAGAGGEAASGGGPGQVIRAGRTRSSYRIDPRTGGLIEGMEESHLETVTTLEMMGREFSIPATMDVTVKVVRE